MSELIPVVMHQFGNEALQTVNARDLHAFLGVKARFNDWIIRRIENYGFVQDIDFILYSDLSSGRPTPSVEYHLRINMAKELSMVERTAKGKEARSYFLECERAAQHTYQQPQVKNPANKMLIDAIVRLDAVEQRANEAQLEAAHANANALRALETQQFLTIAEYVYVNQLRSQLPESAYRAASDHLRAYCDDHIIPYRRIPVGGRRWNDEYAFHVNVYVEAFSPWLRRRNAQDNLRIIKDKHDGSA